MRHAVILAGGSGTRLWPASRRRRPKQFLALGARPGESLLAATARRIARVPGAGDRPPLVVTAADQIHLVRADLPGLTGDAVLAEPSARNTAAALGLAAVHLAHRDPDAVLAALPADHHIGDDAGFAAAADRAYALAEQDDWIVTVGVVPTRAETGFGWLEPGDDLGGGARVVRRFVEKPDAATAAGYLAAGYLWNAGMFFVRARRLLAEIERHLPATGAALREIATALAAGDAGPVTARVYPGLQPISIDHAVMEKADRVATVAGDFGWSDVGSFAALAEYRPADGDGNVVDGNAVFHDAGGNVVVGDPEVAIAVIGVRDLVVVQSGDGILVVPRARAQEVREAVAALERAGLGRFL